jgi:hypothetical protein
VIAPIKISVMETKIKDQRTQKFYLLFVRGSMSFEPSCIRGWRGLERRGREVEETGFATFLLSLSGDRGRLDLPFGRRWGREFTELSS